MTRFVLKKATFLLAFAIFISIFSITDSFAYAELIKVNNFNDGMSGPWQVVASDMGKASYDVSNGKFNVTVQNPGQNRWDIQMSHRGFQLIEGHSYTVKFTVSSTKNCKIYPSVRDQGSPYNEYWNYNNRSWQSINLVANTPVTVTEKFTMTKPSSTTFEMAFHLGGDLCTSAVPYTVSFDDIYLTDPNGVTPPVIPPEPTNKIRVNQVGYFYQFNKVATLVSDSTVPVNWSLKNSSGNVVCSGKTTVKGFDKSSGDNVHIIDFSQYNIAGKDYKLVSDTVESLPFDIGDDLYNDLKHYSIKYFYLNRSGIPIEMPYSESKELARIAIDTNDVISPDPTKDYTGNYSLNITGGWNNDEGNGKSILNSGIATWTLMNMFERALSNRNIESSPYADDTMNIPESGNRIPDILDEARYNLQALLKMQVPEGNTLSGMIHHGVGNVRMLSLTGYVTQRFLQPPSTAATLNLAAVAAQSSRLWKEYDSAFANKCIAAAETAWDAAIANPNIFAPKEFSALDPGYGDDYLGDEFYWAASELYITTGKEKYLKYIQNSKHYLEIPTKLTGGTDIDTTGCFDWCNTAGMGTISLALTKNNLPASDKAVAKENIIKAADKFISIAESQGYGVPIEECTIDGSELQGFPYCSNYYVLSESIVMAYAYEFNYSKKYLNGMIGAMDYILGRNPMVHSYITGYGDNPVENPNHMFWSYQADNSTPKPPAGCLSSGPNSGLQDPWVKGSGWTPGSRPPEKCFMDHIESWSTNDSELNLNAPLAWVSAYIDEHVIDCPPILPNSRFGDINGDECINSLDLAALKRYLLFTEDYTIDKIIADVNGDGSVDAIDFALLKRYILGIIDVFPVEEMEIYV